ncbi:MAG TPA: hypothetical protein VF727_14815 [Allosphingosinicella sp.]|jgi:hypothetical protein
MKMRFSPFAAAPFAALLALSACNNEPKTVTDVDPDPQADALNQATPVTPPPMIQASRTYRCKDNSLMYVDFYTDNTARARTEKNGTPTVLTAANGQPPYTAEGWSVSANAQQVTIQAPGKGSQSCKA